MVAIIVNPSISSVLSGTKSEAHILNTSTVSTISHTRLLDAIRTKRLSSYLASKDTEHQNVPTLRQLLSETTIYVTHEDATNQLVPKERDEKLQKRIDVLQAKLDNDQYNKMVKDVSRVNNTNNLQIEQLRMSKLAPQMSLAANVIITMATCFTAAYYVFKNSSGSQTVGLVAGVIALIIAMIVEVILLITKLYSIDDATQKQQQQLRTRRRKRYFESMDPK